VNMAMTITRKPRLRGAIKMIHILRIYLLLDDVFADMIVGNDRQANL